jgi:hypothetical protein
MLSAKELAVKRDSRKSERKKRIREILSEPVEPEAGNGYILDNPDHAELK